MSINRRNFLQLSTGLAGAGFMTTVSSCDTPKGQNSIPDTTADEVASMTSGAIPITKEERISRIEKAQRLLAEAQLDGLILDAGTSLSYFTGVRWWPSERPMVAIIPARGAVRYVCPAFEQDRLQELITIGDTVYPWQEHESPYKIAVAALQDAGIHSGSIAVEETVRFFILDGIRKAATHFQFVSDPVTTACRLIKSSAEINLLRIANAVTAKAMQMGMRNLEAGMSPADISAVVAAAHAKLGAHHDFALVLFGKASAFPHGSSKPQILHAGDIVLMDCGCVVQGYSSDISRTIVFGQEPTGRQQEIWRLEQEAQAAGFAAANVGATGDQVDHAARAVITKAGFGPGYKLPGLPHRTGHGIGMDGHEWGNMVKGNTQPLEAGMCFSIEPTIAIPGEFGVRLEDCVYMTADGPVWFTKPSPSIDQPFQDEVIG